MDIRNKQLLTWIHRGTCKIIIPRLHLIGLSLIDTTTQNSMKNHVCPGSVRYYSSGNHYSEFPWYSVRYNRLGNGCNDLPLYLVKVRNYSSGHHHHHHKKPPSHSDTHLYDVLHVLPTATQSQIKNAYFKLSKLYHPDVNKSEEAVKVFHEISEAYEILGSVRKRRLYDRGIIPKDLHSEHHGQGGETDPEPHGHGFRRQHFTPRHKQPLTGKTHIYNFDEFYKRHYGEVREKEAQEELKAKVKKQIREREQEIHEENQNFLQFFGYVFLIMLAIWFMSSLQYYLFFSEPDDKHKKDKNR